jgi:hypothetical protein
MFLLNNSIRCVYFSSIGMKKIAVTRSEWVCHCYFFPSLNTDVNNSALNWLVGIVSK